MLGGAPTELLVTQPLSALKARHKYRICQTAAGNINAVAINDSGLGLIGGNASTVAYIATVQSNIASANLTLTLPTNSDILSVAINNSGKGLVGGKNGHTIGGFGAYAAILYPSSNILQPILNL